MAASEQASHAPTRSLGRGFVSLDPERQREIAGPARAAHERMATHRFSSVPVARGLGRGAHVFDSEEVRAQGAGAR